MEVNGTCRHSPAVEELSLLAKPRRPPLTVTLLIDHEPAAAEVQRFDSVDGRGERSGSTRVLIDSNVWRSLVDSNRVEDLYRLVRRTPVAVAVAPAILQEAMRTGDPAVRRLLLKAICRGAWTRLMPTVFEESVELLAAIRNHRPQWLLASPDLRSLRAAQLDWQSDRGAWFRARAEPKAASILLMEVGDDLLQQARSESLAMRQEMLGAKDPKIDVHRLRCRSEEIEGWGSQVFECWRLSGADSWWFGLFEAQIHDDDVQAAQRDWLEPYVDLQLLQASRADWNRFWLLDAEACKMPRHWLRWVMMLKQSRRKTTPGTPADNLISGNLLDCDFVVSSDRGFMELVDEVKRETSLDIATPWQVRSGDSGVGEALAQIAELVRRSAH